MLKAEDVQDVYEAGGRRWLRRWTLVDGQPRCLAAPLDLAVASDAEVGPAVAVNRTVRWLAEQVEALEAAQRVLAGPEPSPTVHVPGVDGVLVAVPNPARATWDGAAALVAGTRSFLAEEAVWRLEMTRAAALAVGEEPFTLAEPPALDWAEETLELSWRGAWLARPLTSEERAALAALRPPRRPLTPLEYRAHVVGVLDGLAPGAAPSAAERWETARADAMIGPLWEQMYLTTEVTYAAAAVASAAMVQAGHLTAGERDAILSAWPVA